MSSQLIFLPDMATLCQREALREALLEQATDAWRELREQLQADGHPLAYLEALDKFFEALIPAKIDRILDVYQIGSPTPFHPASH